MIIFTGNVLGLLGHVIIFNSFPSKASHFSDQPGTDPIRFSVLVRNYWE